MKATRLVLFAVATILAATAIHATARTFTRTADGKMLEGEFVRMKDDKIAFIKRADGQTIELPIAILSEADQAFIKEAAAAGAPGAKKALPEGAEKHTAEKDSESFEITGKFKVGDLLAALRAEGLNGTVN